MPKPHKMCDGKTQALIQQFTHLPSGMLWMPDTFFMNSNDIDSLSLHADGYEEYTMVNHNGTVLWSVRLVLDLHCQGAYMYHAAFG